MFAAVFGQRDFAAPAPRAQIVQPRVFHDAEHPAREIRAGPKLLEIAPGALHRRLHEIVGVVLVARQRTREAAQPRQQLDDAFTDFLRRISHAFMLDNTSGEVIFFRAYPEHSFSRAWLALSGVGAVAAACSCRRCSCRCTCRIPETHARARRHVARRSPSARALRAERLLREHRAELDRDPRGRSGGARRGRRHRHHRGGARAVPARRNSWCCARGSSSDLGVKITVLQTPEGWSASRGLKRLRKLDPEGTYDYNHVYLDGGDGSRGRSAASEARSTALHRRAWLASGLIDGGVEATHEVLRRHRASIIRLRRQCRAERARHGGRVALLVRADFKALRRARDVCGGCVLRTCRGRRGRSRRRRARLDGARTRSRHQREPGRAAQRIARTRGEVAGEPRPSDRRRRRQ